MRKKKQVVEAVAPEATLEEFLRHEQANLKEFAKYWKDLCKKEPGRFAPTRTIQQWVREYGSFV